MSRWPKGSSAHCPERRSFLIGAVTLALTDGCASGPRGDFSAMAPSDLLKESARAHGMEAYGKISDINVAYAGQWHSLVKRLQPTLVDATHRGASEERFIPQLGRMSQYYTGPAGHKSVIRSRGHGEEGDVTVWFNDQQSNDADVRAAGALVADAYSLFLLGAMLLESEWRQNRAVRVDRSRMVLLKANGEARWCHSVTISLEPGLGLSKEDRLVVFIDANDYLMRRVSFTLNGLKSTQGAIAHVDTFQYMHSGGIAWPTRFHEHLERPFPLGVHDWEITGLDINRGYASVNISGVAPQGKAAAPAAREFRLGKSS